MLCLNFMQKYKWIFDVILQFSLNSFIKNGHLIPE